MGTAYYSLGRTKVLPASVAFCSISSTNKLE